MKKKLIALLTIIFLLGLVLPPNLAAQEEVLPKTLAEAPSYAKREVLVKFKEGISEAKEDLIKVQAGVKAVEEEIELNKRNDEEIELVKLKSGVSVKEAVKKLESQNQVEFAEPNYLVSLATTPNDPFYSSQWAHPKISSSSAWDVETGSSSVIVAVIDTGVDYNHPDLAGKVINGYDFYNDDSDSWDDHGHGTHVAGIAAAVSNNSQGVAGLSWGSQILGIKVLGAAGYGYYSDIAQGIIYAADNGAKVINLSLGGSGYSQTLQNATTYAYNRGVTVVAAAGNSGSSSVSYPAGNSYVVGVGATDSNDNRAGFSTYNWTVDVSAPGVSILSTYPSNRYVYMSGTSMATPYMAGLVALVLSENPSWNPSQVESRIEGTANDLGSPGRDNYYGYGRINAYQALTGTTTPPPSNPPSNPAPPVNTPPTAPASLSASALNASHIGLSWKASTDVDSDLAGYKIERSANSLNFTEIATTTATSYCDTSLSPATSYWYRVRAYDNVGNLSGYSNTAQATTLSLPPSPSPHPAPPRRPSFGGAERLWGETSEGTSVAVSRAGWGSSKVVLLARSDYFADALAGVPLAYAFRNDLGVNAPVPLLLTNPQGLNSEARAEIERQGAETVIILGGPGAVLPRVEKELWQISKVKEVQRIWGNTAAATAKEILERMRILADQTGAPRPDTAIIVTQVNFQDALAVSSPAAANNMPILLTNQSFLPQETLEALSQGGIRRTIIIGGGAVVAGEVEEELNSRGYPVLARLWGATTYDTAIEVATTGNSFFNFSKPGVLFVARGDFFADALSGGALAARMNPAPMALTSPQGLSPALSSHLRSNKDYISKIYILGGPGVLPQNLQAEIEGLVQ